MTPERTQRLQALYAHDEARASRIIAERVFAESAKLVPAMTEPLATLLKEDDRARLLSGIAALERFFDDELISAVIAAQQAACLLDPSATERVERAAAAIETAAYAHAERAGGGESDPAEAWERACLEALETRLTARP